MNTNQVARIAGLVGEPARTDMLLALMDGRALTAGELAVGADSILTHGGAADFLDGLNSEPQFPTMLDGAAGAQ